MRRVTRRNVLIDEDRLKSTGLIPTAILLGVLCASTGCKKKIPVAILPPPAVQKAAPPPRPARLPDPPAPQTSPPDPDTSATITATPGKVQPPPPDPPKKISRRRTRRPAPVVAPQPANVDAPAPAPPPVPEPVEPAPKLEQLLDPGQEQSYNQTIDQDLQQARNNLKSVLAKPLSESQQAVVTQVQSFIRQAEDLRKTDLVEAKGLSHKANILASDLARSLQ